MTDPEAIIAAFRSSGFAEVELSKVVTDGLSDLVSEFYKIPIQERLEAATFRTSGVLGYYPSETEANSIKGGCNEEVPLFEGKRARGYCSFDFVADEEILAVSELFQANPWPRNEEFLARARKQYEGLSGIMKNISEKILNQLLIVGKLRGLPREAFSKECCSIMRLLKYAGRGDGNESKAHTDYEFISLIKADIQGLEVRSPDGRWRIVPCTANRAVLLPGDMLEVASAGWIESSLHRVRVGAEGRLAVAFFQGLSLDQEITYSIGTEKVTTTFGRHLCGMLVRGAPHLRAELSSWEEKLGAKIPEGNPFKQKKEP
ncbi:MAG: 2OG-Fe(II) oxygenase family protein [Terracidiphilus sp.]|jgi:isopenicillin N synthase-like dioxygenase